MVVDHLGAHTRLVYLFYPKVTRPRTKSTAHDWWRESGLRNGLRLEILFYDREGELVLPEVLPDFVLLRGYRPELSSWYEARGVRVANSTASILSANDKWASSTLFARTGVATPRSACGPLSYGELRNVFGETFVVKNRSGRQGRQVHLVSSEPELAAALLTCPDPVYQEYVEFSHGRDIRVWVMDGEVIGHVLRHSENDFRSNFSLGGGFRTIDLPDDAARLAVAAARAAGLGFAGVDLLFLPDGGFTVCEINSNAAFRTAPQDIPEAVCRIIAERLS